MNKIKKVSGSKVKLVIVTNIPVPYRNPVYELLDQYGDIDLHVIYCSVSEPDRSWINTNLNYKATFLKQNFFTVIDRYIHINFDVFKILKQLSPEVIITSGYNPTHLFSFMYAYFNRLPHIVMTDGTFKSESNLTFFHRAIRRIVFSYSSAFIGASKGSLDLFKSYGISAGKLFWSPLAIRNELFTQNKLPNVEQSDFLFSGRLVERKNPLFCLDVAAMVAKQLGRKVTLAVLGEGPLMDKLRDAHQSNSDYVNLDIRGFISQEDLPRHFLSSRIFLFPSSWDPWGLVANEACAAALPVIVSPFAGVAGELVQHEKNGFILPLVVEKWAEAAIKLLQSEELYDRMSKSSLNAVVDYNQSAASKAMVEAVRLVTTDHFKPHRKVVIVQRRLTNYRVSLFENMRVNLKKHGVDLHLVHGEPNENEQRKLDAGLITWAEKASCKYFLNGKICWQNFGNFLKDADLLIVTQENKLIYNLFVLFFKRPLRIAFWGHGSNLQSINNKNILNKFKQWTTSKVDWWFAYSDLTVSLVLESGFDSNRVTNIQNSIDTVELSRALASLDDAKVESVREKLGLINGLTAIYIGSLYKYKRIDFLIEAAVMISDRRPGFSLIIIGDGEDAGLVKRLAGQHKCIKYLGSKIGDDKAIYLRLANVMMNPGLVGLGILDSFVAGIPIVTSDCHIHSPEISYLVNNENGLISSDSLANYVDYVLMVLDNKALRSRLSEGALSSAKLYSLENMADRFCSGILRCLNEID